MRTQQRSWRSSSVSECRFELPCIQMSAHGVASPEPFEILFMCRVLTQLIIFLVRQSFVTLTGSVDR
jgi:hypothetical protein